MLIYTDEDVNPLLAEILTQRGYAATTARTCNKLGCPDEEHLLYAAQHQYTLFTHNIRDFCQLAKKFGQRKIDHEGIIVAPQWEFSKLLRATLRYLGKQNSQIPRNELVWLHHYATEK